MIEHQPETIVLVGGPGDGQFINWIGGDTMWFAPTTKTPPEIDGACHQIVVNIKPVAYRRREDTHFFDYVQPKSED